ncbi:MAG TPA: LysR family transcriptional regulator [Polyangiaceae bacterium]|nr:LysR family transcriptional regulator [Polyangiaceae bacterium]
MNIDDLKTFAVVCEAGSLSAAALRLGVPVSTVSRRLAKVEAELGPLVERTGRGVRLRERAGGFLAVARDAVRELEAAAAGLRDAAPRPLLRLRISAPSEAALSLLPEALARVRRDAPDLALEVVADRRNVGVLEENYDLALRLGDVAPGDLIAQPLGAVSMRLVAAPAYLEARAAPSHPRELVAHEAVLVAGAQATLTFVGGGGRRATGTLRGSVVVSTFTEAARLAALGAGVAVLPSYTLRALNLPARLAPLLERWALPGPRLSALYPKRHRGAAAVALACRHLKAVLHEIEGAGD